MTRKATEPTPIDRIAAIIRTAAPSVLTHESRAIAEALDKAGLLVSVLAQPAEAEAETAVPAEAADPAEQHPTPRSKSGLCQVLDGDRALGAITCRVTDGAGVRCENPVPDHGDNHWISDHTVNHAMSGNGTAC